ncbi:hypothetical protein BT69DRAFT_1341489 [Atractiella rhizophila]|nr:hypothetical protein BT69DRAFT_1341489 [Atractiella rhizophila]
MIAGSVWRMQSSFYLPITIPSRFKSLRRHLKFHLLRTLFLGRRDKERTHRYQTTKPGHSVGTISKLWGEKRLEVAEALGWGGFATVIEVTLGSEKFVVKYYNGLRKDERSKPDRYGLLSTRTRSMQATFGPTRGVYSESLWKLRRSGGSFGIILMKILKEFAQLPVPTSHLNDQQQFNPHANPISWKGTRGTQDIRTSPSRKQSSYLQLETGISPVPLSPNHPASPVTAAAHVKKVLPQKNVVVTEQLDQACKDSVLQLFPVPLLLNPPKFASSIRDDVKTNLRL